MVSITGPEQLQARHIAIVALLLVGGAEGFVDIEDIAVKAFELAPTQFSWERFNFPSLEAVRVGFKRWSDMKSDQPFFRSKRRSYALTPAGIDAAVNFASVLWKQQFRSAADVVARSSAGADDKAPRATQRHPQRELRLLHKHDIYKQWKSGSRSFERWEVADMLHCLPDSDSAVWDERFRYYESLAAFWKDEELASFLADVKSSI